MAIVLRLFIWKQSSTVMAMRLPSVLPCLMTGRYSNVAAGSAVGAAVAGATVGMTVGAAVGTAVGMTVGAAVGTCTAGSSTIGPC